MKNEKIIDVELGEINPFAQDDESKKQIDEKLDEVVIDDNMENEQ